MQIKDTVAIEGNGARPSHKGDGYKETDKMFTVNTTEVHAVAYRICSFHSNSMLSDNPYSGCYKAEIAPTLDSMNCGYPACNQGGVLIVQGLDGQNGLLTGDKSCTLLAQHSDYKNVPSVITEKRE